jgi:sulfide:quinone oxidoreductase
MEGVMNAAQKSKVVIAGGGVAALEATLALRELAADRVSVELLAPEARFWYRPLAVAEPFRLGSVIQLELDGLTRTIGATFTPGTLIGVDATRRVAHTSRGGIAYDHLLVACGAAPTVAVRGALTFRGPADTAAFSELLSDLLARTVRSVAFVVPWGAVWSLPAYELALLTRAHLEGNGVTDVELNVITPEPEPLELFGGSASNAMRELLERRDISLTTDTYPSAVVDGELLLMPRGAVAADRFVALPRLRGVPIDGLPQTVDGFIPVDAHCRVQGLDGVYAAGDITSFRVKQGGIAAQQAEVAATMIAAMAGAEVARPRFEPVLRGLLLTGREPRYLRREISAFPAQPPAVSFESLWWPPAKIVGRHLAPFLATVARVDTPLDPAVAPETAVAVDVAISRTQPTALPPDVLAYDIDEASERVAGAMSDLVVVAPEDTLGEVAERLLESDASAAAVVEYGRLVGIVTSGDLLRAFAARVHPSEARARLWMTAEPVTVREAEYTSVAASLMREHMIDHLVVVDGTRAIGMLDRDDVPRDIPLALGLGF